jgi:Lipocalin-like domain
VELSLFPNWVGSDQERWVEFAEDRLILSASPLLLAGKLQVPRLVWERSTRRQALTDRRRQACTPPVTATRG